MPRRVTIIQGHPDPAGNRLCHAFADAYAIGALAAGHQVTRMEVARLDFPILRTQQDFEHSDLPETLVEARNTIVLAQHLVIVFMSMEMPLEIWKWLLPWTC
jgi:putative NADPH-quinone reductase